MVRNGRREKGAYPVIQRGQNDFTQRRILKPIHRREQMHGAQSVIYDCLVSNARIRFVVHARRTDLRV